MKYLKIETMGFESFSEAQALGIADKLGMEPFTAFTDEVVFQTLESSRGINKAFIIYLKVPDGKI